MPKVHTIKGQLAILTLPNSGHSQAPLNFFAVRRQREHNDTEFNYLLRSKDSLRIFDSHMHIAWEGKINPHQTSPIDQWIPDGFSKEQWSAFFANNCSCEVALDTPIIDIWKTPQSVPMNETIRTASTQAMALYASFLEGKSGAYEFKQASNKIDPVVLYFVCQMLHLKISSNGAKLSQQRAFLYSVFDKFEAPKWAISGRNDPIFDWFTSEYEFSQFDDKIELGIQIIMHKIEN